LSINRFLRHELSEAKSPKIAMIPPIQGRKVLISWAWTVSAKMTGRGAVKMLPSYLKICGDAKPKALANKRRFDT
jgi:hypothetical protein